MSGSISKDAMNALEVLQENKYISVRESYELLDYMHKEGFDKDQSTVYMRKIAYGKLPEVSYPINKLLINIIRELNSNSDIKPNKMLAETSKLYPILNTSTENPLVLYSTELLQQKIDSQLIPLVTTVLDICFHFKINNPNLEFFSNVEECLILSKYLGILKGSEVNEFSTMLTEHNKKDRDDLLEVTRGDIRKLKGSIRNAILNKSYIRKREVEICNKLATRDATVLLKVFNEEYQKLINEFDKICFLEYVASIVLDQARCKLTLDSNFKLSAITKIQEAILQNYTIFNNQRKWQSVVCK